MPTVKEVIEEYKNMGDRDKLFEGLQHLSPDIGTEEAQIATEFHEELFEGIDQHVPETRERPG